MPLLCLTLLPVLLLFVGNTFFADSATSYLADHWHDLLRIVASGLLLASYVSLVGLAVASFTSRRAFALGGYAALMLIPTYVGGALVFGAGLDRHLQLIMLGRLRSPRRARSIRAIRSRRTRSPAGGGGQPAGSSWLALRGLPVVALPEGRRLTLVFQGVSKWYGDTVALAEVSFELAPGVTGLLGHNGAGKSTALALCAGFADPSTGTVRVLGLDPRRKPEVYRRIGIVHDRDGLWPFLTARELVELMAGLRDVPDPRTAAAEALASVGLEDAAERRVGGFSKGMRQRVKLAQALVHSPELLLLDEPLNGLDPVQRRHVVELIRGSEPRAAPCSCPPTSCTRSSAWPRASSCSSTGASWPRARQARSGTSSATGRARSASPPAPQRRRLRANSSARASRAACASITACSSSRPATWMRSAAA